MPDISGRDGSKPTMLIMDNDRMALMALQSILAKALPDFELLPPVSEGSKAIQLCTATKRPPAVLLADIAMNDINGRMWCVQSAGKTRPRRYWPLPPRLWADMPKRWPGPARKAS